MSDEAELFIMNPSGQLVREREPARWMVWMQRDANRILLRSEPFPGVMVSTVFLGIAWGGDEEEPMYFDTMILGGPRDGEFLLSPTRSDALIAHDLVVELCRANPKHQ